MSQQSSTVVITYDGNDITSNVLYAETNFESQILAVPGMFTIALRDRERNLGPFVTGKEVTLTVDGILMYGGFVTAVKKGNFFEAVDTSDLTKVRTRKWILTGVDFNVVMDKRVLRNTADYTHAIPSFGDATTTDGDVIRGQWPNYFDLDDFDLSDPDFVQDLFTFSIGKFPGYAWDTQGTTFRDVISKQSYQSGAFYYFGPDKKLRWESAQSLVAPWNFSDSPADSMVADPGFPYIGYREGTGTEDATPQVDDAFVWGGSTWANDGDVVFARRQDAPTIAAHYRWQYAENHVGDTKNYGVQSEVDARANLIVSGSQEGGDLIQGSRGLLLPEQQYELTWFSYRVPRDGFGVAQHLVPGNIVSVHLWTFSEDGGLTPFIYTLPLKQLKISFALLDDGGLAYVKFEGFFGIQQNDAFWIWDFLLRLKQQNNTQQQLQIVSTANPGTTSPPPYGTLYSGGLTPAPDGATVDFFIPFAYIAGSTALFINGLTQRLGLDYTESDPANGKVTLSSAPVAPTPPNDQGDLLELTCRTA